MLIISSFSTSSIFFFCHWLVAQSSFSFLWCSLRHTYWFLSNINSCISPLLFPLPQNLGQMLNSLPVHLSRLQCIWDLKFWIWTLIFLSGITMVHTIVSIIPSTKIDMKYNLLVVEWCAFSSDKEMSLQGKFKYEILYSRFSYCSKIKCLFYCFEDIQRRGMAHF